MFEPDYCLICDTEMYPEIGWRALFFKNEKAYCCEACKQKLEPIHGEVCIGCGRPLEGLKLEYQVDKMCYDCVRWERNKESAGLLVKNESLYVYNDYLKEVMARFKFRGDYLLIKAFSGDFQKKIRLADVDFVIPIPLSTERQYERGFNQAEALIREAGLTPTYILQRLHTEKQSKKSRTERIHLSEIFCLLKEAPPIVDKKILIIDDIYTTGSTLRAAAKVLRNAGAKQVQSLTLAR